MRYATFINWTDEVFTGYWNGKPYTFNPGQKGEHLHESIAQHFAKHLTNQVLQNGSIKDGEKFTSPKKPEEVPKFMELFNKAFKIDGDGQDVDAETGLLVGNQIEKPQAGLTIQQDEPSMNIKTKPRELIDPYDASNQKVGPGDTPQMIGQIDETTEEENFEDNK